MKNKYINIEQYVAQRGFYEAVVEDGADIIFVVDYNGKILYSNPSVKDNLGYTNCQMVDTNFNEYIHPDMTQEFIECFENCKSKSYEDSVEFKFKKSDDTYSYLELNSVNLKHKEGIEGLILDCRDINQRKKNAEELIRAQKAKEQFMANMSHEIRTPINGIAGMITLLAETNATQEQLKYIEAIKTATENLKVIINDILDISIIESGKLKFEKVGFSIKNQLQSVLESFQIQAKEKKIFLEYHVDSGVFDVIIGDPVRLSQILINLISNALKFTHSGGIKINVSPLSFENDIQLLKFDVIDTGIGIAEDKLETIFDSFTQADESVTRKFGGTGLGLAICKQLVDLQNGSMNVVSTENQGSTFSFQLPFQIGQFDDLINEEKSKILSCEYPSIKDLKVLLVEDNDINRLFAVNILKKWDCNIETAENGYIATEKCKKENFDIILMDIQMPVMDGMEATKVIRENSPNTYNSNTPIIALTANVLEGNPEKYATIGMNGYLSKPFHPDELREAIFQHVNNFDNKTEQGKPTASTAPTKTEHLYDLTFLESISDEDNNVVLPIINTFVDTTPDIINRIVEKSKSNSNSWGEINRLSHQIKSSVKMLGITKLYSILAELETLEPPIDRGHVYKLINNLKETYKTCLAQLKDKLVEIS